MFDLPPELQKASRDIEKLAREGYGLDFHPVEFLMVSSKYMNELASHVGFPRRFRHWTNGLEFEKLKQRYDWGLGKIYEMVINNVPAYAYLMENNSIMEQKLVMAHVFGHSAVFKTNLYFASTRKDMVDVIANNAARIERYYQKYGIEEVEAFIDACMSIEEHIDCFAPFADKSSPAIRNTQIEDVEDPEPPKVICDPHLDMFINPEKELAQKKKEMKDRLKKKPWVPAKPQKDLLLFLLQHAPLKKWQEDVLSIIREESYYFNPQRQTKILNEGFASYYHFRMMTEHLLEAGQAVDFAMDHSGTLGRNPYSLNPYYIGFTLLRDIEDRYNKGRFGKEFDNCTDAYEKANWIRTGADGYKKLMEIMAIENDYSLIDKYLTPEYCEKHELYKYEFNESSDLYEVSTRDFDTIKNSVLDQLSNFGIPYILVVDGNFANRGELLLMHKHEFDLNMKYAEDTLKNIFTIWKRPVHLATKYKDEYKLLSFGGPPAGGGMGDSELSKLARELHESHRGRI